MDKIQIKKTSSSIRKKTFDIVSVEPSSDDLRYEILLSSNHSFSDASVVNIDDYGRFTTTTRPKVMVGAGYDSNTSLYFIKWKVDDESDEWNLIDTFDKDGVFSSTHSHGVTLQIDGDRMIDFRTDSRGNISYKPVGCSNFYVAMNVSNIDTINYHDMNSIAKTSVLGDNYFSIPRVAQYVEVTYTQYDVIDGEECVRYILPNDFDMERSQEGFWVWADMGDFDDVVRTTYNGDIVPQDGEDDYAKSISQAGLAYYDLVTLPQSENPNIQYRKVLEYNLEKREDGIIILYIWDFEGMRENDKQPINITNIFTHNPMSGKKVWYYEECYSILLPSITTHAIDTTSDILLRDEFMKQKKDESINAIVDYERVRTKPVHYVTGGRGDAYIRHYTSMRINLHFLKKDGSGWDDDATFYEALGFDNTDVKYQKKRLSQSFLKISYYNEPSPTKQYLIYYNTIFVDMSYMYKQYLKGQFIHSFLNSGVFDGYDGVKTCRISQDPMMAGSLIVSEEKFRLSFEILDPTNRDSNSTSSSSEGFYVYPLMSDIPDSSPVPLFVKYEFYNASNGQKTVFFNRKTEDVNGCELKNVFMPANVNGVYNEDYLYVKMFMKFDKNTNSYIYYPAPVCGEYKSDNSCTTVKNSSNGDADNYIWTIDLWEAKIL